MFPFTAGSFPFKRRDEDPTRMFAGEGDAFRTNRRFKYLSAGYEATRLSTAFDSVTLYGRDPDPAPDIYGKVGTSGVSICSLDDLRELYAGFDLLAPNTSVSMTINGPAPATFVGSVTSGSQVIQLGAQVPIGIAVGMALTPQLAQSLAIPTIQLVYALAALVSGLVFALVAREYPKVRLGPSGTGEKALMIEGLKDALANPSFRLLCIVAFIVLGLFNGVNTWIEAIVASRGFGAADAGTIGAIILVGGIIGAVALPALSDRSGRRLPWIALGIVGAIPSILGLAFFSSHLLVMVSAFFLGFFLTSILPVGMQYSTEITRPVPEGTTGGLIQLAGQASVVFVFLMDVVRGPSRSFDPALVISAILLALSALLVRFMKEAPGATLVAAGAASKG